MIHNLLLTELEMLLSESKASAKQREQSTFDEMTTPFQNSLVIFGAGNIGKKTMRALRLAGIEPHAFSDNNSALWGSEIEGVTVLSPSEAANRYGKNSAFVVTIWRGEGTDTMAERCEPLRQLGCNKVVDFGAVFWKFPDLFLPHYSFDLPHKVLEQADEIRSAFKLFEDLDSQKEFIAQIRWRLWLDFDGLPRPVQHEIYFPQDLVTVSESESFVDCGAFDGDTMRDFLNVRGNAFGHYTAFEADPKNYRKLLANVEKLPKDIKEKITTYAEAVGARREKVYFDARGTESSGVGGGSLEIDSVPLDEILLGKTPTWIKMDIEGSEPDALKGANEIISLHAPVLAICVYHQQNHLWLIPLMISKMFSNYKYFLRPHLLESWDLVCYAIPTSRCVPEA
ncbi:MAG: FkbM family methyltransferase [Parachlamydiaceae bacterium]